MRKKLDDITKRVTSYETACKELGITPANFEDLESDEIAYKKLKTIARALNEGWAPNFTKGEYRYYPWFYFYTQEEIKEMSEYEKRDRELLLFGGTADNGSYAGLGVANSLNAFSPSPSNIGARLAVKNRDLAIYFGKQFIEIWADFVYI